MKNIKKLVAFLFLLVIISFSSYAQDYNTAIGVRLGSGTGITIKHFIESNAALEGILDTRWEGVRITGLYEVHKKIPNANGLGWYYGVGAHIGFWSNRNLRNEFANASAIIGIDGIIALDYTFKELPLNLSVDWKPAFNIIGYSGFWGDEIAVGIRYAF